MPQHQSKILLTGANGYIGKRLLPALLEKGHFIYCMVRNKKRFHAYIPPEFQESVQVVEADMLKKESLKSLPLAIDAAYYLLHSMKNTGDKSFQTLEAESASNFVHYVNQTSCQQLIFLSGIMNDDHLSPHLKSRKNVENILQGANCSYTIFRAAIIVGSGSASFEIIRDLVKKLPVMVAPKWLNTKCQPIGIRNVIYYLKEALLQDKLKNKIYDIGGPDTLTYKQMLKVFGEAMGLKRYIYTLPVLTPKLSSYWLYFVTSTSYPLAKNLVDSMKNEVVVQLKGVEDAIARKLLTYRKAVDLALSRIAENRIPSTWKDAFSSGRLENFFPQDYKTPEENVFKDIQRLKFDRPKQEVIENIWSIGGERGWYYANLLWRIRGFFDKMAGGVGTTRGRRSNEDLQPSDALDFWRVVAADKSKGYLLLYAEMILPGEAWLSFEVKEDQENGKYLEQIATFKPKGLMGKAYWYALVPAHYFIFHGMAARIIAY